MYRVQGLEGFVSSCGFCKDLVFRVCAFIGLGKGLRVHKLSIIITSVLTFRNKPALETLTLSSLSRLLQPATCE